MTGVDDVFVTVRDRVQVIGELRIPTSHLDVHLDHERLRGVQAVSISAGRGYVHLLDQDAGEIPGSVQLPRLGIGDHLLELKDTESAGQPVVASWKVHFDDLKAGPWINGHGAVSTVFDSITVLFTVIYGAEL